MLPCPTAPDTHPDPRSPSRYFPVTPGTGSSARPAQTYPNPNRARGPALAFTNQISSGVPKIGSKVNGRLPEPFDNEPGTLASIPTWTGYRAQGPPGLIDRDADGVAAFFVGACGVRNTAASRPRSYQLPWKRDFGSSRPPPPSARTVSTRYQRSGASGSPPAAATAPPRYSEPDRRRYV